MISIKRFLKSPKSLVKTKIKLTTEDNASDKTSRKKPRVKIVHRMSFYNTLQCTMAKGLLFQSLLKSTDLLACDGGRANIVFGLVFPKLHGRNITRLEYELLYIQGKKPQLDYQAYQYNIIT